jgi:hypothetical protein
MAFSAVAEAQGSSRAQIRNDPQNGFTRPLEIPREPRWGLRQALHSTCRRTKAASPDRRARRIKAAGVEACSPFDQGLRESPPLMTENARQHAASRRIRRAAVNHQRGPDAGADVRGQTPTEGRADNFLLDINSVTAAWPGCEWNPSESAADIRYLLQRTWVAPEFHSAGTTFSSLFTGAY